MSGVVPVQVPGLAVSVCPCVVGPEIVGSAVFAGATAAIAATATPPVDTTPPQRTRATQPSRSGPAQARWDGAVGFELAVIPERSLPRFPPRRGTVRLGKGREYLSVVCREAYALAGVRSGAEAAPSLMLALISTARIDPRPRRAGRMDARARSGRGSYEVPQRPSRAYVTGTEAGFSDCRTGRCTARRAGRRPSR